MPLPLLTREALMVTVSVPPTPVADSAALALCVSVPCAVSLPCTEALALLLAQGEGISETLALPLDMKLAVEK